MEKESKILLKAKIVEERPFGEGGTEIKKGTKHFLPGAKVYVIDAYWGECAAVTVIGHHRTSGRYVKLDMSVQHLENFQLRRVYSPTILSMLNQHFGDNRKYSEDYASEMLQALPHWQ